MGRYRKSELKILVVFVVFATALCSVQPPAINPGILTPSKQIGDCKACKIFIESFKNGLERTARGKYEGGDAAWEEEKLKKSYKRSEMRLLDIQEGICKETKHSGQCHLMAEKAEEYIEQWWAQNPDESDDLFTYICIDNMKVCCPVHHYGKDCTPCPGDHNNICNGNGKCRGDGTRKGNGTCLCESGYTGENCEQCTANYYVAYTEGNSVKCRPCHMACKGGCRDGSPKDCVACAKGFTFDVDEGCTDINECDDINKCTKNQFCVNALGTFMCMPCDKSCDGCHSDGPDGCRKCARGYSRKGEFCIQDREDEYQSEKLANTSRRMSTDELRPPLKITWTMWINNLIRGERTRWLQVAYYRYMTYIGLLIATIILLPMSVSLGGIVGGMVLAYIVAAEYYCMINGHNGLVDLKEYDLMQLFRT